jgi:uncharacterized membrane protein YqaE (UPF0057 family)
MKYMIAIVLPPVGLLLCGKVLQAVLNLVLMLTLIGWPFAALWAVLVVHNQYAEQRADRLIREIHKGQVKVLPRDDL